ncbi:MAG: pre-peptidase C-terminal domain-containing protein [Cytophaga sp.]|uniref:pre-peptidase C-terminal domain-containing protein n=1 Tax=Cytophaga sp. TaxID=29535 RepID=UPI003F815419
MKKKNLLSKTMVACMAFLSMNAHGQNCNSANYEPNNSVTTPATFQFDYPMEAAITGTDIDYYKITVPTFGELSITLAGFSEDLDLELLTLSGASYASSAQTSGVYESINWHVPGGPNYYLVKVSAKSSTANSCYQLFGTFTSGVCTPNNNYEPNESSTSPAIIYMYNNIVDKIGSSTDVDWYQFSTYSGNTLYRIYLNNPGADYDMELYTTGTGGPVASSSFYGVGNEFITFNGTGPATYKIRVSQKIPGQYNLACYTLRIQESYVNGNSRTGNNSTLTATTPLYPNPASSNDLVYLSFAESSGSANVQILGCSGNVISNQNVDIADGMGTLKLNNLQAGVYLIKTDAYTSKLIVK